MQALFLYSSGRKDTVITLSEIHRPSEIPVLIWHQGCVLPKVGFLSQVLDHGDGGVVEGHTSLAGGGLQLANFHVPAWLSLQALPPPHLFYATLQVEDSVFQVNMGTLCMGFFWRKPSSVK